MKALIQTLVITALCFFITPLTQAQSPATAKGASILSGTFSFTSQGGDLYSFGDDRFTNITIAPGFLKFVSDKIGVGGDLSLGFAAVGDNNSTSLTIGPKAAYFFDNGSTTLPFISLGVSFMTRDIGFGDNANGFRVQPSGGIVIRKGHVGFVFEGGVRFDNLKPDGADDGVSGNIIFLAVGINAFLFNEE